MEENGSPYDPERFNPSLWLKEEAHSRGLKVKDLLAMAPQRDPFNCGTPADWEKAAWFKEQYQRYGHPGIHLRRLHYRISNLGQGQVPMWDGMPYENNKECWKRLGEAFTA